MKAPEKIYLNQDDSLFCLFWHCRSYKDNIEYIEYIRADAFIEKAAEWLSEIENGTTITDIDKFVEDFKKSMKGE